MNNFLTIAIDGPASSGKSTVSKQIAKDLNLVYIDTGAMYRALTLAAIRQDIDFGDELKLAELLENIAISFEPSENGQLVFINGEDITQAIRSSEVTNNVSQVSFHESVRSELVKRQRELANSKSVIMDGRDIGTVVLPNANVKIFLVASVKERAERRYKENLERGINTSFEELTEEIVKRDEKDSNRKISPLKQAEDAVKLDTTGLTIPEVVKKIKQIIEKTK